MSKRDYTQELSFPSKLDKTLFGKLASRNQLVKCSNGHYNGNAALFCWKCGAALSLKGFTE
jgi:hypothetical protein